MEIPTNQVENNNSTMPQQAEMAELLKKQEYYHLTTLGFLEYFKEGAKSDISDGEGQGYGFYMWADRKRADAHADFQKRIKLDNFMTYKIGGKEIVINRKQNFTTKQLPPVKLTFEVNPDECEPDWEVCGSTEEMFNFLCENENIIRGIPTGDCKIENKDEHTLMFDKIMVSRNLKNIVIPYINGEHGIDIGPRTIYTCDAAGLAYIMHYFRDNYPNLYKTFVSSINPEAVKYIGEKPIFPSKVELLKDGCWKEIDVQEYFKTKKIKFI